MSKSPGKKNIMRIAQLTNNRKDT